jgi:hypothetical protein
MKTILSSIVWVVASLAAACSRTVSLHPVASTRIESVSAEWTPAETAGAGTPATWQVVTEPEGQQRTTVESLNGTATFNLLLSATTYGPNVDLAVRVRADSGEIDRGGGLMWRALDANNYYVTRWNPLEDNLRLYTVKDGVRTMLATVEAKLDPAAWHELRVTMIGARILVVLAGGPRIELDDATLTEAGGVGLWTKADASTSFAGFEARTLPR